jgi:hypothetical protein
MCKQRRISSLAILLTGLLATFSSLALAQSLDPFQQHIDGVELKDQNVVDGIAMLTKTAALPVSVEFPLGAAISGAAPPLETFSARIEPGTVSEVLDRLCVLDPTFTWIRDGNRLNVLPRILANDPTYVLNKTIEHVKFEGERQASDAIMKMVEQLPGPREQLAVLQAGMSLSFPQPWSTTIRNTSIRQVINQIAQQLGSSYGWQFSGAQDFRVITFHEGLLPKPSRRKLHSTARP